MSVRLLVDMNLSPNWVEFLEKQGIEATHWSSVGDPAAPDAVLMEWARGNGYAVFTHDLDFGTALALTGATGPSVLQLRGRGVLPSDTGAIVVSAVNKFTTELEAGALLVIDEARLRVKILSLGE